MSSEQEEGANHMDEPNANSNANVDQSEDQQGNGLREHAKPRRRRRGKKRKQKKESAAACEAENPEECESELHAESEHDCDSPEWGSDESLSCNYDAYTDVIIRPVNVPMAPLNSTQFIMDDHDDCRFYMSFETPNPYGVSSDSHLDREDGDIIEPISEDAAYIDIDYQYESPQDFDNSAYYDKEFELSYKNNRFEELMRLSRTDLLDRLQSLESRLKEVNEDLVKENPSPILEKLQTQLLELQEKNFYLKESNSKLTTVLLQNEDDCSETVTCPTLEGNVSGSYEHESGESDREAYEECNESVEEVIMSNIDPTSETPKEACDTNFQRVDCERGGNRQSDHSEDESDQSINPNEDFNQTVDRQAHQNALDGSKLLSRKMESEECSSGISVVNSEDRKSKPVHSNSHVMLCQPNNLVSDDLRTLNITSSDLFHIANQTCSSLVPREGGMSPSETSVN